MLDKLLDRSPRPTSSLQRPTIDSMSMSHSLERDDLHDELLWQRLLWMQRRRKRRMRMGSDCCLIADDNYYYYSTYSEGLATVLMWANDVPGRNYWNLMWMLQQLQLFGKLMQRQPPLVYVLNYTSCRENYF